MKSGKSAGARIARLHLFFLMTKTPKSGIICIGKITGEPVHGGDNG